jgi:ABC-type glycerol-3-phosphate transport system substrate-binding protein
MRSKVVGVFCIAILGVILFSFLGFYGCAQERESHSKVTITVWHWMTDRQAAFEELAARYEKAAGIRVKFELFTPSDAYSQKIIASAQGKTLPDIFGILGKKRDAASFIKAGYALDLTKYMDENMGAWRNQLFDKALNMGRFTEGNLFGVVPGIYAVPIDLMNVQMIYNRKIFKEAGLDPNYPPVTFTGFIEQLKKLKEKNFSGFVSGFAEAWLIDSFAFSYAFNIMGEDKVMKTLKGEVPYTDPDWIKVFTLFQDLREAGGFASGVVSMDNKYAEQSFANEKSAFVYNGSWCINVYKGMNPELDYAVMMPPKVVEKNPMVIWGSAGAAFYVNAASPNAQEAVRFLKWLTDDTQQVYLIETTLNLPANKNCLNKIPKILSQFTDDLDKITHPNIWSYEESPKVTEVFARGIQSIIIGEKSPETVAAEVQVAKQKELKK